MNLLVLIPFLHVAAAGNMCGLGQTPAAAAGILQNETKTVTFTVVAIAGISQSTGAILGVGPQFAMRRAYQCFLGLDMGLAISAYPGSKATKRNVPTTIKTMTLEWITNHSSLPLNFNVFVGTTPFHPTHVVSGLAANQLTIGASGLVPQSYSVCNLEYFTPYYWKVSATDPFGRGAQSAIYSFSLAPAQGHLVAAPNPFTPGSRPTTFMFNMAGPGSATLEILSLPDAHSMVKVHLHGLTDGVNTYTYDGRDGSGRFLPNGVYVARLSKNGANGNAIENFKLVSVR